MKRNQKMGCIKIKIGVAEIEKCLPGNEEVLVWHV